MFGENDDRSSQGKLTLLSLKKKTDRFDLVGPKYHYNLLLLRLLSILKNDDGSFLSLVFERVRLFDISLFYGTAKHPNIFAHVGGAPFQNT